jgi:SpoVK/Ycf46/Vps4 family AAA+-type ATPase
LADDIPDAGAGARAGPAAGALEALLARCRLRDTLADGLGAAARTRYRPGVRALLVGPSGTGKTLAASWVATRLGLPLYRVDLASVTSKYIGETEKNLVRAVRPRRARRGAAALRRGRLACSASAPTSRTANDRFANQQTNYLLQRIESFEGITLLTSNSRARFDSAFTRRLDAIIEFLAPGPVERRALWLAHLGESNILDAVALNRLAANCDLPGGHIRNVVLAAAALGRCAGRCSRRGGVERRSGQRISQARQADAGRRWRQWMSLVLDRRPQPDAAPPGSRRACDCAGPTRPTAGCAALPRR